MPKPATRPAGPRDNAKLPLCREPNCFAHRCDEIAIEGGGQKYTKRYPWCRAHLEQRRAAAT